MNWFRRSKRTAMPMPAIARRKVEDQPDVEGARAKLARAKARRPDVDALVTALVVEKHLNNFSANLTATFRGGRT